MASTDRHLVREDAGIILLLTPPFDKMTPSPGYIQENTIVKLETNVYDVGTEKLVWSGVSETLNPETAQDVANSVAFMLVDDMKKSHIIQKG